MDILEAAKAISVHPQFLADQINIGRLPMRGNKIDPYDLRDFIYDKCERREYLKRHHYPWVLMDKYRKNIACNYGS